MIEKENPVRSAAYLNFIRSHPCCSCSGVPTVAHHYMEGKGGTGIKCSDTFTVPLCNDCHSFWHSKAYLPCFQPTERVGYEVAGVRSRALMYQAEARLLDSWMSLGGAFDERMEGSTF